MCYTVYSFLGHTDYYTQIYQSFIAIIEFRDYENNPGKEFMKPASPFPSFRAGPAKISHF